MVTAPQITVVSALCVLAAATACRGKSDAAAWPDDWEYVPSRSALTWVGSDSVLLYHAEEYRQADVRQSDCTKSGIFAFVPDSGLGPVWVGTDEVCSGLARRMAVSPDGSWGVWTDFVRLRLTPLRGQGESRILVDGGLGSIDNPAWSFDGRHLAFTGREEREDGVSWSVFVMRANGHSLRRVGLWDRRVVSSPSWAPDGHQLAVAILSTDSAAYHVAGAVTVIDISTGATRVVARGYDPSWSPQGDRIAYLYVDAYGDEVVTLAPSLRIVRPDGTGDSVVYATEDSAAYGQYERMVSGSPWAPIVWSPNGMHLAFSRMYATRKTVSILDLVSGDVVDVPSH